jgi:uncharacterized protein
MKTIILSGLVILALGFIAGWIYIRHFEFQRLYHPSMTIETTPAQFQLRYHNAQFMAADDTPLTGWWIPANRPRGTILFCHGNAGNIGSVAYLAPEFFKRGFNVLLWDYRGYGQSGGRPSERGFYTDARAAFDAAKSMGKDLPIILYGQSLGGAVAIHLATERPADGLIIESSFSSAADVASRWYPSLPIHKLLSVSFDSASLSATLDGLPKLFGHSPHDDVIPFQSGRILHASAAFPKTFSLLSGGHNDNSWFSPGEAGNEELEAFLSSFKR